MSETEEDCRYLLGRERVIWKFTWQYMLSVGLCGEQECAELIDTTL